MSVAKEKTAWGNKQDLLQQVKKWWERGVLLKILASQRCDVVEDEDIRHFFPKRLVFKTPTSKDLTVHFDDVRRWIAAVHKIEGFRIEEKTIQHRILGENKLPIQVWVDSLDSALALIGKQKHAEQFSQLILLTKSRLPEVVPWLANNPLKVLDLAEVWEKILLFIQWRKALSTPSIYLREVSIQGIDSKFIETHKTVLMSLLDIALPEDQVDTRFTGVKQFAERYGFKPKPLRIRFRLLDSSLAKSLGLSLLADGDVTLSVNDFSTLADNADFINKVSTVFITENEINFLSFPDKANSIVIFGAGYGFDAYTKIDWFKQMAMFYWGDIDTHGFAILDQLRRVLPQVQSLLMDENTLLAHRNFWGVESTPTQRVLSHLTDQEMRVYDSLVNNAYAQCVRLEQERIGFECVKRIVDIL